jgi:hypothetical protein
MGKTGRRNSNLQKRQATKTNLDVSLSVALARGLRERARTLKQVIPELPPKERNKQARRLLA